MRRVNSHPVYKRVLGPPLTASKHCAYMRLVYAQEAAVTIQLARMLNVAVTASEKLYRNAGRGQTQAAMGPTHWSPSLQVCCNTFLCC